MSRCRGGSRRPAGWRRATALFLTGVVLGSSLLLGLGGVPGFQYLAMTTSVRAT